MILRFACGALGSFVLSDAVPSPYSWDVGSGQGAYFPHQPADSLFIGGREGTLAVPSLDLWRHEAPDGHWQRPLVRGRLETGREPAYVRQLDHLIAVARGQEAPVAPARDATRTLAVTLAVARAAREGRPVEVDEMYRPGV